MPCFRSSFCFNKKLSNIHRFCFSVFLVTVLLLVVPCFHNSPLLNGVLPHGRHLWLQKNHKMLLPLDGSDKWGLAFASLSVMIAAGGGIGGGGMLVPIYILVMRFTPKYAIPLSNVTVFGGALANTAVNWNKRHPLADRPLIDWDIILIMEPLTIAGALIGSLLNKILPEKIIMIMLVLLLTFIAYTTLAKAVSMYKKESDAMKKTFQPIKDIQCTNAKHSSQIYKPSASTDDALSTSFQNSDIDSKDCKKLLNDDKNSDSDEQIFSSSGSSACKTELLKIIEDERKTSFKKVASISALFFFILLINILKGGGADRSVLGITYGSLGFWVANASMIFWILIFFLFSRVFLTRQYHLKKQHRYKYVEGDIEWSEKATLIYPGLCCYAGFFSGMFGIGGGIVKGPLMLQMGVNPAVISASCSTMILYTCFTSTASYATFGLLQWDYAFVCTFIGLFSSLIGQYAVAYLLNRYGRQSIIAFSVGCAVLFSAILMTAESLMSVKEGAVKMDSN